MAADVSETSLGHDKYNTSVRLHEAGFDSFLTAKVLTRLAAKVDCYHKLYFVVLSETGLDERESAANEYGTAEDVYLDPHIDEYANVTNQPSTGDSSQVILTLNRKNRFQALSLNDQRPSPPKGERRLMMPPADHPFWSVYGNKLRVNGTVEEVCTIGTSPSRESSLDSFENIRPPGFWISS